MSIGNFQFYKIRRIHTFEKQFMYKFSEMYAFPEQHTALHGGKVPLSCCCCFCYYPSNL